MDLIYCSCLFYFSNYAEPEQFRSGLEIIGKFEIYENCHYFTAHACARAIWDNKNCCCKYFCAEFRSSIP